MTNKITAQEFVEIVNKFKNKIFSVKFVKKDGSIRDMNCRLGVKKYVTGKGLAYDPEAYGLLTAFDMQKEEYRMINTKTLISAKVSGEYYEF